MKQKEKEENEQRKKEKNNGQIDKGTIIFQVNDKKEIGLRGREWKKILLCQDSTTEGDGG